MRDLKALLSNRGESLGMIKSFLISRAKFKPQKIKGLNVAEEVLIISKIMFREAFYYLGKRIEFLKQDTVLVLEEKFV